MLANPITYLKDVPDPRRQNKNLRHPLENILMIALSGVICGFDDWVSIEEFGNNNKQWLSGILDLSYGIPSHDTFSNVMRMIDKDWFATCFANWIKSTEEGHKHIAIDGKFLQGGFKDADALHLVTAFASETKLVLAQASVDKKDNEISTLPDLLKHINLEDSLVTGDAIYCQKDITKQITKADADYIFALKGNHKTLFEDVKLFMDTEYQKGMLPLHETIDKDHGRIEIRRYALTTDVAWLEQQNDWFNLNALAMVESTRIIGDKETTDRRYYLTSLTDLRSVASGIRSHWSIENSQHWVLDVIFGEDRSVKSNRDARANKALLTRVALNLIRANGVGKMSVNRNKVRASQNYEFREQLLFGCGL